MMIKPMNRTIARKCFAELVLDYEWKGDAYLPPSVTCRVLIDGCFCTRIYATTIDAAIEYFNSGAWKEA